MAPMKNKDANKPGKKLSAPRQIDPTPINKENLRSSPKGARKNAAAIHEAVNNDPPRQVSSTPPPANNEVSDVEDEFDVDIRWDCNQIRSKIRTYVNNTGITLKDFQSKINVSANSYRTFVQQSGPNAGAGNNTYMHAHRFFDKREAAGLSMPRAKQAKKKDHPKKDESDKFDVSGVTLDGEAEGNVPVYDTCNDVRTKIQAHLRKNNVTQAAFARAISACQGEHGTPIQGKQITDFTSKGKRGPMSGNTSKAFYAAYVYFEKLRVKEGKKKSKKREKIEQGYAPHGLDRVRVSENVGVWCHSSERPTIDNLGQVDIQPVMRRT